MIDWWAGRLGHLIWNDRSDEALDALFYVRQAAPRVAHVNGETSRSAVAKFLWNCDDPRRYLENAGSSLINHGARYGSKRPISTSQAEGCVDEIASARMAKKQRIRWSPQGAHRVAVVRAAVLDCRFGQPLDFPLAA